VAVAEVVWEVAVEGELEGKMFMAVLDLVVGRRMLVNSRRIHMRFKKDCRSGGRGFSFLYTKNRVVLKLESLLFYVCFTAKNVIMFKNRYDHMGGGHVCFIA
jgi:hypothetical protein